MDIESIKTPYDLIETILDHVKISARPINWNEEIIDGEGHIADGSLAIPMEFEASCPHCSQMIIFKLGFSEIQCPECGRGKDVKVFIEDPFQDPGKYGDSFASAGPTTPGDNPDAEIEADDAWEPMSDAELDKMIEERK